MITGIDESKTLTKHISCKYKCKFDGRKCNSNQKWNNDKCPCERKKHHRIRLHKVITRDEIIDAVETNLFQQMLMKKMQSAKQKFSIFYLPFY